MHLPAVGSTFHGYAVEAELGRGGYSIVYRAVDMSTGATVALKALQPDDGLQYSTTRIRRFHREAEVLRLLDSPYIVRLLNAGTAPDGLLYLVFELVDGVDLSNWMSGPVSPALVRQVIAQVLDALTDAHEAGVLHRDIKPSNIRVWSDNGIRTKLLDFGIARPLKLAGPALTATGELVGTVRFLAPEQLRGAEPTPAADLYSLGLVAFEMLTGERSDKHRMAHGAQIQLDRARVPDDRLRRTVNRMLSDNPAERPPSARAARQALDREPSSSRSSTLREIRPERPAWVVPALGGLAAAIVIAAGGWVYMQAKQPPAPIPPPATTRVLPTPAAAPEPPAEDRTVEDEPAAAPAIPTNRGCGIDPPFLGRGRLRALDGMTARDVVAHVPREYDPNRRHPLIILLHQWGDDAGVFLDATRLSRLAEKEQFVIIAPQDGPLYPWADVEDMEAVRWALELARDELCIDDQRIYGLGNGDGGMIVEQMPCELEVAAIATTAFRNRPAQIECDWTKTKPVPYLMISGTADQYNPIEGGEGCDDTKISLADKEQIWRDRHGCAEGHSVRKIKTSECWTFRNCAVPLQSCRADGGHQWPYAPKRDVDWKNCDGQAADFPYRDIIWQFFSEHAREP